MANQLTAWSYSRYKDFVTCPRKCLYKYIEKVPEPPSPAMERGEKVHKTIAQYLSGEVEEYNPRDTAPIPGWTHFGELFNQLRALDPIVEQQWAFSESWQPVDWFAKNAWLRSVLDACVTYDDDYSADMVDHKTGRAYPDHREQAEIFALSIFYKYPHIERVTARFWYLDSGEEEVFRYSHRNIVPLSRKWEDRAEEVLAERRFAATPGRHCNWCSFARSKGGPCRHG